LEAIFRIEQVDKTFILATKLQTKLQKLPASVDGDLGQAI